jgi:AcrR family transcriptional regulator
MDESRQQRRHDNMITEIKSTARQQMAVNGAAALSLGGIARAMGLSTPALYRYFSGRDALVTDLIMDACTELSETTERAVETVESDDFHGRFRAVVYAYRRWALSHPQDYILVHGAVFPGYELPVEAAVAAAASSLRLFVELLADARATGRLRIPESYGDAPQTVRDSLVPLAVIVGADPKDLNLVVLSWMTYAVVHGLVWTEVSGQVPESLFSDGGLFDMEMNVIAERLGLT